MARVNPTRMELLALRAQIRTASEGARLLKGKRDALMREFLKAVDTVVDSRHELADLCAAGMNIVNTAKALEGEACLESAAMGTRRALPLEVRDKRIWGVAVPEIELRDLVRAFDARGYNPATTPVLVEETAAAFEKILNQALVIAVQETRLRRLGEEVRVTSSRVNALEQILIPGLRSDVAGILAVLEERAREEVFRLKRLKRRSRATPDAAAGAAQL
ncbi:MAG TPA: V-type ATP synthase subunit D [Candidatus Methanoperedens sp.]|nr:V-type ATP synthase subunit D [Candidatus Methanoperedens sp.]